MRRNRLALLFVLFIAQAALAVPLAITTLGVSTSTPTTATITWTTTGTSAAADTRVSYTGGGVTSAYIDGARVTSHSATLTGLQPGVVYTYTASSQSATETATGTAATFSLCQPNSGKLTAVKATLYSFYAYGAFTATWHDISGIGTTPKQCGVAITTPVSGTLDINGNLSVSLPDVNQVTPSVGAWTIAFSSFASTGSVSVDISPTGQNFDASATIQAQVTSGNKGPVGGSGGVGSGTVTSVATGTGLTGGPITTTGTVTMADTAVTPGAYTSTNLTVDQQGRITAAANGSSGGVTSVATTTPIGGGTITGTGTLTCTTCVVASSPGAGIAHFAGSTQTVTSSAIVAADITSGTITGTQLASSTALPNGVTATTQSASDNSTKVATTAYVDRAAPAMVQLETHAASTSATLDFTTCISGSTYHIFRFQLTDVVPATANQTLAMRLGNGGTYDSGNNYAYQNFLVEGGASSPTANSAGTALFNIISNGQSNSATLPAVSGWIEIYDPLNTTRDKGFTSSLHYWDGANNLNASNTGTGTYLVQTAVNDVRFLFASGNIASGTITCYGVTP